MNDDGTVAVERLHAEPVESLPRRFAGAGGPVLTPVGNYDIVVWDGINTSGWEPVGDTVLLLPDQPSTMSAGGVYYTDQEIERRAAAAETGVIVEIGDGAWAWNFDRTRKFEGTKPKIGQRVWFERYAGTMPYGQDGLIYRGMTDRQIGYRSKPLPESHEYYLDDRGRQRCRRKETAEMSAVQEPAPTQPAKPVDPPPEPAPMWPKYTTRDGALLLAFNEVDAQDKAPGARWWPNQETAARAAGWKV